MSLEFPGSVPRLSLVRRSKRSANDDFHDRLVDIDVRGAGGAVLQHQITIGRGLIALYDDSRTCTVSYNPPQL